MKLEIEVSKKPPTNAELIAKGVLLAIGASVIIAIWTFGWHVTGMSSNQPYAFGLDEEAYGGFFINVLQAAWKGLKVLFWCFVSFITSTIVLMLLKNLEKFLDIIQKITGSFATVASAVKPSTKTVTSQEAIDSLDDRVSLLEVQVAKLRDK
jgi:hypothetical protein